MLCPRGIGEVKRFTIGEEKLQVAMIQFTSRAVIESGPESAPFQSSPEGIAQKIVSLRQRGGMTSVKARRDRRSYMRCY